MSPQYDPARSPATAADATAEVIAHGAPHFVYAAGARPLEGFTILRGVGQGGFGEIYQAVSDAGKEVALKLVRRHLDIEVRGMRHCLNLTHPNLLDLYDIRQDAQGDTWIVMEFVAGPSLEAVLASHPQGMPVEAALRWMRGIAAGVAHLHGHGIVHRDLKPGNIFLSEGLVKVGDYGLSKYLSCSRRSGHTESIGTVHYVAPEVANGRYGKEIDIYALGIVLYEMLTGHVPFDGESVGEVLMKHLTAQPDLSAVAEPYRAIVARAMEKDPAKRFADVAALMAALPAPSVAAPSGYVAYPAAQYDAEVARPVPEIGPTRAAWEANPGGARPFEAERPTPAGAGGAKTPPPLPRNEDPLGRELREGGHRLRAAARDLGRAFGHLPMPVRILLLVAVIYLGARTGLPLLERGRLAIFVPVMILGGLGFVAYLVIRAIVSPSAPFERSPRRAPDLRPVDPPSTEPPEAARPAVPPPLPAEAWRGAAAAGPAHGHRRRFYSPPWEKAAPALVLGTPGQRLAELLGSMMLTVGIVLASTFAIALVAEYQFQAAPIEFWTWLALTSVVGAWAVLVPSKLWEGTRGESLSRRLTLGALGLGVGMAACFLGSALLVEVPRWGALIEFNNYRFPPEFYGAGGQPLLLAYVAVFATLMLVVRWWRQANPLRRGRLSLWTLVVVALFADLVAALWHFPGPWLSLIAVNMSLAVQLSSPWVPHRLRKG